MLTLTNGKIILEPWSVYLRPCPLTCGKAYIVLFVAAQTSHILGRIKNSGQPLSLHKSMLEVTRILYISFETKNHKLRPGQTIVLLRSYCTTLTHYLISGSYSHTCLYIPPPIIIGPRFEKHFFCSFQYRERVFFFVVSYIGCPKFLISKLWLQMSTVESFMDGWRAYLYDGCWL